MRLSLVASATIGALCAADQSPVGANATEVQELLTELAALPACDLTCIQQAIPVSTCDLTDLACLCADEAYIQANAVCLATNCTIREALAAEGWQKKACHAPVHNVGYLPERIGTAFLVTAAFVVALRFLARYKIEGSSIGADDWAVLGAFIMLIPSTAIAWLMTKKGKLGQDIWTATPNEITSLLKYFYMEEYFYQVCIYLTKLSIVLLYMRIFPREVGVRFNNICWVMVAVMTAWVLGFLIYFPFECRPFSFYWTQWDGEHTGSCNDFQAATYINSAFNILFDLILLAMPIPRLAALQVKDIRRKIGVILIFMVGVFVTICSIVRLQYIASIGDVINVTYYYNDVTIWSGLEGDVGVVCCCLPILIGPAANLFKRGLNSTLGSLKSSKSKSSSTDTGFSTDKSMQRLPSSTTQNEYELDHQQEKKTIDIEKTVVTSMYDHEHASDGDDVELIVQSPHGRRTAQPWDV